MVLYNGFLVHREKPLVADATVVSLGTLQTKHPENWSKIEDPDSTYGIALWFWNSYAGLGPSGFLMITYGTHWYVLQIHSPEIKQGKRKKPHTWPWTKKGLSRWPQSKDRVYKPEYSLGYTLASIRSSRSTTPYKDHSLVNRLQSYYSEPVVFWSESP